MLRQQIGALWIAIGVILAIALFYFIFHSAPVVEFRNNFGGVLKSFQADRFYWLYPALWYFSLAISAEILLSGNSKQLGKCIATGLISVVLLLTLNSNAVQNPILRTVITQATYQESNATNFVSWREFFGEDIFNSIKEYLGAEESKGAFVSIGLYPSIPLYNGLVCLDGYSNNYPLSYKHSFRNIISGELEKSISLQKYFDDWGNRCYVFSHELGQTYLVPKEAELAIQDLSIDTQALKVMGGKYLLSTVPLNNAEECNLEFLKYFESNETLYSIYLYKVA